MSRGVKPRRARKTRDDSLPRVNRGDKRRCHPPIPGAKREAVYFDDVSPRAEIPGHDPARTCKPSRPNRLRIASARGGELEDLFSRETLFGRERVGSPVAVNLGHF